MCKKLTNNGSDININIKFGSESKIRLKDLEYVSFFIGGWLLVKKIKMMAQEGEMIKREEQKEKIASKTR